MQVTFHFDPGCPWTWITSRWLVNAAECEDLEIRWAPLSLAHLHDKAGGREGTRIVQHLLDRGEHEAVARFYDAVGDAAFRKGDRPDADRFAHAAQAAGLDDEAVAAARDASLDDAVAAATDAAFAAAGPDVGSPILQWSDDQGQDVWVFGPLFDRVVDPACAAELWRGVRHLAVHDVFKELKRGRSGEPDLRAS